MESFRVPVLTAIFAAVVLAGLTFGMSMYSQNGTMPMAGPAGSVLPPNFTASLPANFRGMTPYKVTLVVLNVPWNSTGTQPAFYELKDDGLVGAYNVSLPVNTLIQLTIATFDTPSSTPPPTQYANVTGVVGGNILVVNGTISLNGPMNVSVGQWVSSVPLDSIAHTFTISQYGVNIPLIGTSVEVAYLYLNGTGVSQYQCMVPCGTGPSKFGGAMSTPGWMTGTVKVYAPSQAPQQQGANATNASTSVQSPLSSDSSSTTVLLGIIVALVIVFVLFFVYRK